jgi:hypothetical protein
VRCNVPVVEANHDKAVLPERVQRVLGQLVGAARDGLLAVSVEVGLGVLRELLEEEVDELVGAKGKWNPDRTAVRHGHEDGEVTLGGRRVQVERPRARTVDGESHVPLQTYVIPDTSFEISVHAARSLLPGSGSPGAPRSGRSNGDERAAIGVSDGPRIGHRCCGIAVQVVRHRAQMGGVARRPARGGSQCPGRGHKQRRRDRR